MALYATGSSTAYAATPLSDRFTVYGVPMFSDNYGWLIADRHTKQCAVVDPGDAAPIAAAVASLGLQLTRVLITHYHGDHQGGNARLKAQFPDVQVVGTGYEPIDCIDVPVKEGASFDLFGDPDHSLTVQVIATPCHTAGHVVYYIRAADPRAPPALFSGDTLFVGGCGRFFEGNAQQMYTALVTKMGPLPDETLVFCAHEYTQSNLQFALQVEPDNAALQTKLRWVDEQRKGGRPTVPSTLGEERSFNPFVRCGLSHVMARVGTSDPIESMHRLREGKNRGRL
eukprot:EG_transcript_14054